MWKTIFAGSKYNNNTGVTIFFFFFNFVVIDRETELVQMNHILSRSHMLFHLNWFEICEYYLWVVGLFFHHKLFKFAL